jgi:DNA-binding NarL/FixJ family response regulator
MARGRKPGRDLTELELRHLRLVLYSRNRALQNASRWDEELEDFVLLLRETGASNRGIAAEIDVSPSTVQTWVRNAKRRRNSG